MNGYTKLFSTILTSTIWQEPIEVKVLWITMLALSDKNGYVSGSIPGLAHVAGISLEACQKGIQCLSSPDSFSRTKIEDGRRIRETDGGWELVNHAKYRVLLSAEERKEYNRRKQQEHRERQRAEAVKSASNMSAKVKQCQQKPDIADADSDQIQMQSLQSTETNVKPTLVKPKKSRERNELLDCLATLGGGTVADITGPAWSKASKALADIREVSPNLTVQEIKRRADNLRKLYPNASVTDTSLAKHWARCDSAPNSNGHSEPSLPINVQQYLAQQTPQSAAK